MQFKALISIFSQLLECFTDLCRRYDSNWH